MAEEQIEVEVAFAKQDEQLILTVQAAPGITVQQAIEQSGMLQRFPEIEIGKNRVGVFGKVTKLDAVLQPGDRVEIYRPLIADPKEQRKKRTLDVAKETGSIGEEVADDIQPLLVEQAADLDGFGACQDLLDHIVRVPHSTRGGEVCPDPVGQKRHPAR